MNNKISMQELLEKFTACEMFSLTGDVTGVKITANDKTQILKEIKEVNKEDLRQQYNTLKEKDLLIPFDKLYQEIEKECRDFKKNYKDKYSKKTSFLKVHIFAIMSEKILNIVIHTATFGIFIIW